MVQFREIKRIFKEVTGKRCRVFWKDGLVNAEYVCYYTYGRQEPLYRQCLEKSKQYFESSPEWLDADLRKHFKQYN